MKRLGLIIALIIVALGAWVDWTYHAVRTDVTELSVGLPSVEDLSKGTPEANAEKLKRASITGLVQSSTARPARCRASHSAGSDRAAFSSLARKMLCLRSNAQAAWRVAARSAINSTPRAQA